MAARDASVHLQAIPFELKPRQVEFFHLLTESPTQDMIVNLPVGYGKSILYYLLPEFLGKIKKISNPVVIVLSPLTLIQKDQLHKIHKYNIQAVRLDQAGQFESGNCDVSLASVKEGCYPIILCHPEGLICSDSGKWLLKDEDFQRRVVSVVVDECHVVEKWEKTFRTAYGKLKTLPAFFPNAPMIAMSGTLTVDQMKSLPTTLGLINPKIIEETPDRPNVFLRKFKKKSDTDALNVYEEIFISECDKLKNDPLTYPITLMFMPLKYISYAASYLRFLFGSDISVIPYSVIFSNQDREIIDKTIECLQENNPHIRLILSTAASGMGFDPPSIEHVIHACPPRNISQYLQEIGRAGRRGQSAKATLYYSKSDIALCLPEIQQDIRDYCHCETCLREALLAPFGFKPKSVAGCQCCSYCKMFCTCQICSVLVPDILASLDEEFEDDVHLYEDIETTVIAMDVQ